MRTTSVISHASFYFTRQAISARPAARRANRIESRLDAPRRRPRVTEQTALALASAALAPAALASATALVHVHAGRILATCAPPPLRPRVRLSGKLHAEFRFTRRFFSSRAGWRGEGSRLPFSKALAFQFGSRRARLSNSTSARSAGSGALVSCQRWQRHAALTQALSIALSEAQ
jgi:hypothetical protein